jgi:hypothetical protein
VFSLFCFALVPTPRKKDKQQQVGRRIIQDSLAYLNACLD